jgi:hypothetical protein
MAENNDDALLRTGRFFAGLMGVCAGFFAGMLISLAFAALGRLLPESVFLVLRETLIFLEEKSGIMTMACMWALIFALLCQWGFTWRFNKYHEFAVEIPA